MKLKEAIQEATADEVAELLQPLGADTFPELLREVNELRSFKRVRLHEEQEALQEEQRTAQRVEASGVLKKAGVQLSEGETDDAILDAYLALPEGKRPELVTRLLGGVFSSAPSSAPSKQKGLSSNTKKALSEEFSIPA